MAITDLTGYLEPDWYGNPFGGSNDAGVYKHRGRVYLQGAANYAGAGSAEVIFTAIPEEFRPPSNIPVDLPNDQGNSDDADPTWSAIMGADGTLTLETPWGAGVTNQIAFESVSWQVAELSDDYASDPISAYYEAGFADVDGDGGIIGVHGERVHIDGTIVADGTSENISLTLPAKWWPTRYVKLAIPVAGSYSGPWMVGVSTDGSMISEPFIDGIEHPIAAGDELNFWGHGWFREVTPHLNVRPGNAGAVILGKP